MELKNLVRTTIYWFKSINFR